MTPEQIEQLLEAIKKLSEAVQTLAARSEPDPFRDLKIFVLGLATALLAGWVSHWLTERREQGTRKLEEWERLKGWEEEDRKADLRGTDLTPPWLWLHQKLPHPLSTKLPRPRYLDLEEINLGADKQHDKGANLVRAKMALANLANANLENANLSFIHLEKACLEFANLRATLLRGAELQGADLRYAKLEEADLSDANLQDADLGYADLQGADLRRVNLQHANLAGASLQETYLMAIDLEGANLAGTSFRDAHIRGANLRKARWDDETVWPERFIPPENSVKT